MKVVMVSVLADARCRYALFLRREPNTLLAVGRALGVGPERARQLIAKGARKEKYDEMRRKNPELWSA